METARRTREDRQAQTRADLIAAARERLPRAAASTPRRLDEIAEQAGYTKGAVYSNFAGKDDLFLALLAEHYARRAETYAAARPLERARISRRPTARIARVMLDAYAQRARVVAARSPTSRPTRRATRIAARAAPGDAGGVPRRARDDRSKTALRPPRDQYCRCRRGRSRGARARSCAAWPWSGRSTRRGADRARLRGDARRIPAGTRASPCREEHRMTLAATTSRHRPRRASRAGGRDHRPRPLVARAAARAAGGPPAGPARARRHPLALLPRGARPRTRPDARSTSCRRCRSRC